MRPSSSNCFLVIHILLNALSDDTVAPPTQQECCLLFGAISVGLLSLLSLAICLWSLSQKSRIKVVLPATTMLLNNCLRRSMSHLKMQLVTISWTPGYSRPIRSGLNKISGAAFFSAPIFIFVPSGN